MGREMEPEPTASDNPKVSAESADTQANSAREQRRRESESSEMSQHSSLEEPLVHKKLHFSDEDTIASSVDKLTLDPSHSIYHGGYRGSDSYLAPKPPPRIRPVVVDQALEERNRRQNEDTSVVTNIVFLMLCLLIVTIIIVIVWFRFFKPHLIRTTSLDTTENLFTVNDSTRNNRVLEPN